ncbi:MAG: beta-galactosidase [Planctomycetia bacterium]|nr:beta-galactosidase [Planctomycetia bacterium]
MKSFFFWSIVSFVCGTSFLFAYERFEVKTIDGVPMMTLDGNPAPCRIFWGRPGNRPFWTTDTFREVRFDFTPRSDAEKTGTFHFRFGKNPGKIVLDDFCIVEKATGKKIAGPYTFEDSRDFTEHWETWHRQIGDQTLATLNVVSGCGVGGSSALEINILPGNEARVSDFHLYHQQTLDLTPDKVYTVSFTIRSDVPRRTWIAVFRPGRPFVYLGGMGDVFASQVRMAGDVGVDFVSFMIPQLWPKEDGTFDFREMDSQIDGILKANPKAMIIPRLPVNATGAWLDAHPEERMVWYGFDHQSPGHNYGTNWASPCSRVYRKAACDALRAAIRHLEAKYGNAIAGYHPAGQNTQEWFTINTWRAGHVDYSPAARNGFRLWLREKYATDAALQKAWGNPDVTRDTAEIPPGKLRDASLQFYIIDPSLNPEAPQAFQSIVDFNAFFQKQMTDTILDLAHVVKEETDRKKLSVFFYGYGYEFAGCAKGPAASAHYNLRALLDSPDIDIIASPMSYFDRQPGGGGSCMVHAESVTAAGKIYIYEDDTSTYLAVGNRAPGWGNGSPTLEGTQNLLLRNTAEATVRNFGTWWMDLGGSGWFDSPDLWKIMAELRETEEHFRQHPTPFRPDVAVFLDEKSMLKIGSGRFSGKSVSQFRRSLNRLGTPYAQYLLDDLLTGRVPVPKVCVVTNIAALSESRKAEITRIAQAAGSKVVWVPQEGFSPEKLREEVAAHPGVFFFTKELCNVWANGGFVVVHAPEDGVYHLNFPSAVDILTGKPVSAPLPMKKGETRFLKMSADAH